MMGKERAWWKGKRLLPFLLKRGKVFVFGVVQLMDMMRLNEALMLAYVYGPIRYMETY